MRLEDSKLLSLLDTMMETGDPELLLELIIKHLKGKNKDEQYLEKLETRIENYKKENSK